MNSIPTGAQSSFAEQMRVFTGWRESVAGSILDLRNWIADQKLASEDDLGRLDALLRQLQDDKLRIAFVAEFSRGKSELINAMFFSGFGERVLPSGIGSTTQCPTELHYDTNEPPCLKLLPIETREENAPLASFARQPERWTTVPLDLNAAQSMARALAHITDTVAVRVTQAMNLGLYHPDDGTAAIAPDGTISIPRWRHAIVNFPHPLLEHGLVILDTPGLNAIGTEPELTLNLIPDTHAVVFVLGIDTGVTKSDLEIWNQCVRADGARERVALVALNKIDGLWGEGNDDSQGKEEIRRQISLCAERLGLSDAQIFPISAKKALLARHGMDVQLLAKSRLPELELALATQLIPARQRALREELHNRVEAVAEETSQRLQARLSDVREHLTQLRGLRGKNEQLSGQLTQAVTAEAQHTEAVRERIEGLRKIIAPRVEQLLKQIELGALRARVARTRGQMLASAFSRQMQDNVAELFEQLQRELTDVGHEIATIHALVLTQCELVGNELGLKVMPPFKFPAERYFRGLERLRNQYRQHFQSLLTLMLNRRSTLVAKFFDALAMRLDDVYSVLGRDLRHWLTTIMNPLTTQLKERESRLARRVESMKGLLSAGGDLEKRIVEIEFTERDAARHLSELRHLSAAARATLSGG